MIKIDRDGLTLCKIQGQLFEKSIDYVKTSSSIFIRRFMNSKIVLQLDSKDFLNDTKSIESVYQIIDDEYSKSTYGSKKYDSDSLYWMGYIYRYFAYTYNISSKHAYKMIKPEELYKRYYVYHTFDPAYAIDRMLEEKGISFDLDKQNERLFELIRQFNYEKHIKLIPITSEVSDMVYMNSKGKDKYSSLFIMSYHDLNLGEIKFKNVANNTFELSLVLASDMDINKDMIIVALGKALQFAKDKLKTTNVKVSCLLNDDKLLNIYKELGFIYINEDDTHIYLEKLL